MLQPLAASTIGTSPFAPSREPPAHPAQKGAGANASPPARAQVALLISMPVPWVAHGAYDADLPHLEIGTLELDLLH